MTITILIGIISSFTFLVGACTFSIVNVLIYRLPRQIPFGNERSICPNCKQKLKVYDMIPIFSYMLLRGQCRYCKTKISRRYPMIEALGGVLAVLVMWRFGAIEEGELINLLKAIVVFILMAVLTAISFIDIDTLEIPNKLVFAVLVCGVISIFLFPEISLFTRGIGIVCISIPLATITFMIPGAFGGGDIKLMAALGVFLGWKLSLVAFAFAVFSGGIYGIYLLIAKGKARKAHFAFGPFLCAGVIATIFGGYEVIKQLS